MNAPFYKIKTQKGEIGWIYAGALTSFPVEVEHPHGVLYFLTKTVTMNKEVIFPIMFR